MSPTLNPTVTPTLAPTAAPTLAPTVIPTVTPSHAPTLSPTTAPTPSPTTTAPTVIPTVTPSYAPTLSPTTAPTPSPTTTPSHAPSDTPTIAPTPSPSIVFPSSIPSDSPTSLPSSQPTSQPTSKPTVTSNAVSINFLNEPLTTSAVNAKINYYLGTYLAYFLFTFIVLTLLDWSRIGKEWSKKLHIAAYRANHFTPDADVVNEYESARMTRTSRVSTAMAVFDKSKKNVFKKLVEKDYSILLMMQDEAKFKEISAARISDAPGPLVKQASVQLGMKRLNSNRFLKSDDDFSEGFFMYIEQRRTYFGCGDILFPEGKVRVCGREIALVPSILEDFLLFLCNNHSVLNCLYGCDKAPVDRWGNRLIYITQQSIAFFMSTISGCVFEFLNLPIESNIAFDIVVTTPATIAIAKLMKVLYTCPLELSVEYQAANPMMVTFFKAFGRFMMIPVTTAILLLLILAAIISTDADIYTTIGYFFVQVQVYGFFLELFFTGLMFVSNFYMRSTIDLRFRSIILLEVGRRYTEGTHSLTHSLTHILTQRSYKSKQSGGEPRLPIILLLYIILRTN
jgi:hypothetical protein